MAIPTIFRKDSAMSTPEAPSQLTPPRGRPPLDPIKRALYDLRVQALHAQRELDQVVRKAMILADAIDKGEH